jgi:hypothetical protein
MIYHTKKDLLTDLKSVIDIQQNEPIGFMSYNHFDNKDGCLTEFCDRLSYEVKMYTGDEFPVFQDCKDIQWGWKWKIFIEESLKKVVFFIPIITPSFFKSKHCLMELKSFIKREKILKCKDLILPVYYVRCPTLDNVLDGKTKVLNEKTEKLVSVIASHQFADWRELRFKSFDSECVRETLAKLAVQICNALERMQTPQKAAFPKLS